MIFECNQNLFLDYLSYTPSIREFYPRSPLFPEWVKEEAARVRYDDGRRKIVADILDKQNRTFGAGAKTFANIERLKQGAFAGIPVQLVSGAILTKWAALGYETGVAGSPAAAAVPYLSFRATSGLLQNFQNAAIVAPSSGPQAGRVFVVTGLVLAKYAASGGPVGTLGAPINDEFAAGGRRRQDFEGGYIDYAPGDTTANVSPSPRQPLATKPF